MTRILGIDPGTRITGYGVLDSDGNKLTEITHGVIRLPAVDHPERLAQLFNELDAIIDQYVPQEVSIEQVFMARSAASALKLGQARGAAIVTCARRGLTVSEYAPRRVKQAVTASGAANKEQVQLMVTRLLALPEVPSADAADALALAICHAHSRTQLAVGSRAGHSRKRRSKRWTSVPGSH